MISEISFIKNYPSFWDEFTPELASLQSKFDKEMYNSKFKDELKKEIEKGGVVLYEKA